jgi:hypothetical protein
MSALFRRVVQIGLAVVVSTTSPAAAQTATATFSANFGGIAKFSLSGTTVTFPDADPDTVPQIPASSGPLTITVKTRATPGSTVRLTILATDNLRSGVNTIPATALSWTTTGAGYVGGTANTFAAQTLGSWTNSGINVGTQNYRFQNSWSYVPGTYNVVLMYTLTAP